MGTRDGEGGLGGLGGEVGLGGGGEVYVWRRGVWEILRCGGRRKG